MQSHANESPMNLLDTTAYGRESFWANLSASNQAFHNGLAILLYSCRPRRGCRTFWVRWHAHAQDWCRRHHRQQHWCQSAGRALKLSLLCHDLVGARLRPWFGVTPTLVWKKVKGPATVALSQAKCPEVGSCLLQLSNLVTKLQSV